MTNKTKLIVAGAVVAVVLVGWLLSWNVRRLQARMDADKLAAAAQIQKIADHTEQVEKQNTDLLQQNAGLMKQVAALVEANQQLSFQIRDLHKSAAVAASQVPSMQPTAIAQQIATLTGADPRDVVSQPSGAIVLSPDASQKDLVALVLWKADHDSAPKFEKQQENFQAQLDKAMAEIDNLKTVVANKDKEIQDAKDKGEAKIQPLKDEIKLLKAKALKRGFFATVGGIVAGIVIKAVWL